MLSQISVADVRSMFDSATAAKIYGGSAWEAAWQEGAVAPRVSCLDIWRRDLKDKAVAPPMETPPYNGKQSKVLPWRGVAKARVASTVRILDTDPSDAVKYLHQLARGVASDVVELNVLQAKVTDGKQYVNSVNRTLQSWLAWCASRCIDPVTSDAEEFCHTYMPKGKHRLGPTVARKRYNHLSYTCKMVKVPAAVGPAPTSTRHTPKQAEAVDPELPRQIALMLLDIDAGKGNSWRHLREAMISFLLEWASELRFVHLQRSVLVKVSHHSVEFYCLKGKSSPGFPWSVPCKLWNYPLGLALWQRWTSCLRSSSWCYQITDQGVPLTIADFVRSSRAVLVLVVANAELFTSHSNRRSLQTLSDMVGLSESDQRLLGGWSGLSSMPNRYSAFTRQRVKVARLALQLTLETMAGPLSWELVEASLTKVSFAEVRSTAARMVAEDEVVYSTPLRRLPTMIPLPAKFQLRMKLRRRSGAPQPRSRQAESEALQAGGVDKVEAAGRREVESDALQVTGVDKVEAAGRREVEFDALQITEVGNVKAAGKQDEEPLLPEVHAEWVATLGTRSEQIHLLRSAGVPYCQRRQAADKAKPLKVEAGRGDLDSLTRFASGRASMCPRCMRKVPPELYDTVEALFESR